MHLNWCMVDPFHKPNKRNILTSLGHKESWAPKNRCLWTVVLEKILESPLDCKEIQPVHPKGDQSWVFTGRTDVEAETPILQPPDVKSWLTGKDPNAGKDWRQEKGMTDEMVGWYHRLNGQVWKSSGSWWWTGKPGMLQSMGSQKLDTTEWMNWTEPPWNETIQVCPPGRRNHESPHWIWQPAVAPGALPMNWPSTPSIQETEWT